MSVKVVSVCMCVCVLDSLTLTNLGAFLRTKAATAGNPSFFPNRIIVSAV